MTDDERTRQPLSMTRRYRRGLILTGVLCALAMLAAATVLFPLRCRLTLLRHARTGSSESKNSGLFQEVPEFSVSVPYRFRRSASAHQPLSGRQVSTE